MLDGVIRLHLGEGFAEITYTKVFILVASFAGCYCSPDYQPYPAGTHVKCAVQQDRKWLHSGINTSTGLSLVFVIGAAMAGLAGVPITMNYGTFDFYVGFVIGIKAFTAAVLGGSVLPGDARRVDSGVAEAQFSGMVNPDYKDVLFGLLVMILIFRPQGCSAALSGQ